MKKRKIQKYKKIKTILILVLLSTVLFYGTHAFNKFMEPQLFALAKQHVGFAINNIVKEVLNNLEFDQKDLIHIHKENDTITNIEYDSYKLNQILYSALNTIDASLLAAQDGEKDPTTKKVFYDDGILYEVPLGYFSHLYFLYDVGPLIHIRMKLMNDVTGELKTSSEPYGINNTLIKISLRVNVNAQVLTYLSSKELNSTCEIPIILQVINGKVPSIIPFNAEE